MDRECTEYKNYISVLNEELLPAMGCTEPVAIAYAAAKCRETLGCRPEVCNLYVSGNIIKNVKSVVVPNTGGLKGLRAAVAAGIVAGRSELMMDVIADTRPEQIAEIHEFLGKTDIYVERREGESALYIEFETCGGGHSARTVISDYHTNIVLIERDGEVLWQKQAERRASFASDHGMMTLEGIWDFVNTFAVEDAEELLVRQMWCNEAISREGLKNHWGAEIGRLIRAGGGSAKECAMARAAAGSDARMSGCEMPVVIVGGSGNQGLTVTMPILEYAARLESGHEKTCRALALADLLAVYLKRGIGRLSAYCTAVTAGAGAGCAIAYLDGSGLDAVRHTIINALGILSGMFCDGAKPSCAAKVANSVANGILAYEMYKNGTNFCGGDGFLQNTADETINVVAELARLGMQDTDRRILEIMVSSSDTFTVK